MSTQTLFQSYLFAYIFWLCLALGCFGLMLTQHVIQASWGRAVLRLLEAGAKTLPLMAVLFLPILFVMAPQLYIWLDANTVRADHALQVKSIYLNYPFFIARAVFYFVFWIGLTYYMSSSSLRQDRTGDQRLAQARANIAAPCIVVFVLTVNFAFTDWVMSLDPHWNSTIFGVWFMIGQGLLAISFVTMLVIRAANSKPFSEVVTPQLTRDLGNLMLTFTMLWAYFSLSQFLIMWSGNLPEEIGFYARRMSGGWNLMGSALMVLQFLVPFLLLLSGRTKRTPGYLFGTAALLFIMRIVDVFWNVIPFFQRQPGQHADATSYMIDLVVLAVMGVVWLVAFNFQYRRNAPLPLHGPRLQEALEHA